MRRSARGFKVAVGVPGTSLWSRSPNFTIYTPLRCFTAPVLRHKPERLVDSIEEGEDPQIVDVRDEGEHKKERLNGTLNIPLKALKEGQTGMAERLASLDKELPVYLHDDGVGSASEEAAGLFLAQGFLDVRLLEGGVFEISRDSGLVVEKD